jgi:hypothetical protein
MSNDINNRNSGLKNDKQEKSSNPFLNPIKREKNTTNNTNNTNEKTNFNNEEKINRFNVKNSSENNNNNNNNNNTTYNNNNNNNNNNRRDNRRSNNEFKERNYQNNNNMFKNSSNDKRNDTNNSNNSNNNDNNFSLDNEEMFPSLGNNSGNKSMQETKPALSYKTIAETPKTEINRNNEKSLKNGWLSLSKGQDISKIYKKEAELRNKRENMRALNELSKQRIEEIKASYEYNYIWNEEKRNEMLYGISKQETNTDNFSDDQDEQYADDDNYNYYNKKYSYDN